MLGRRGFSRVVIETEIENHASRRGIEKAGLLERVRGALAESEKLSEAMPERFEFALNAGVCARALGDTAAASRWFARAAAAQRSVSGSKANE